MPTKNSKTFVPSEAVKKRISNWEGAAMNGITKDPHSGKMVKKNNSFENEAYYFYHAIPSSFRDKILANQELADNLFSYSYNVGSGTFKDRVVPALTHYFEGNGRTQEVLDSMYSKADYLPGLGEVRRPYEKEGVRNNMPPKNAVPIHHIEQPDAIKRTIPEMPVPQRRDVYQAMKNTADYKRMMDSVSIQNNPAPKFMSKSKFNFAEGGPVNHWNNLSIKEKADMMKVAVRNGITNLADIKARYNEFAEGGHVYEVLPQMLRNAGLNVRVTSGYRKAGAAGKAGSKSWHTRHGAVDIVPQGKTTFADIENVLYNNPEISQYMLANGLGLLDESGRSEESKATMRKTGATGAHFHIGKDTIPAKRYATKVSGRQATTMTAQAPVQQSYSPTPMFMPSSPEMFAAPISIYQPPVIAEEPEQPLVELAKAYSPEEIARQEKRERLNNFSKLLALSSPSGQDNSISGIVSMLSGGSGLI